MSDAEETYPLRGDVKETAVDFSPPKRRESSSSSSSNDVYEQDNTERGEWGNKIEFFLAIMGYTVGIGSVWRFPIICSRNGGGAFLIPFFFFLITSGGPLYYMEVCLGQFTGKSAGLAFEFCPLIKGVGHLQVVLSFIVICTISIFILTWTFYFLYNSVFSPLPWTTCGNWWNTPHCEALADLWAKESDKLIEAHSHNSSITNDSAVEYIITELPGNFSNTLTTDLTSRKYGSSAYEFWEYNAVGRSRGLDEMGSLQLHLVICSFLAWAFVVLAVIKGVKTLGKVVYVTATVPFVFLGIMFIRGVTLDGSVDGMIKFIRPDFRKLLTFQVWLEAAIQVFYSLGPTWGGVITMASYNKFHQKSFLATTMCVASVGFSSFFNGLVVFTILGFMAKESGLEIHEVASASGPGLAFVAFPTALSRMPLPQLWSVLFFLMLITVVFDSIFGMFETVTSGVIDFFPKQLTNKRVHVNIVTGLILFILGLPITMNGGIYLFQLADWYVASFALLVGSFFESIGICWFYGLLWLGYAIARLVFHVCLTYLCDTRSSLIIGNLNDWSFHTNFMNRAFGADRFAQDIEMMTGRYVSGLLRLMWSVVIPSFTFVTFFVMLSRYSTPAYGDGYDYPTISIVCAIVVALIPIVIMVGVGLKEFISTTGRLKERLNQLLIPTKYWQPNDHEARETYRLQPYRYASTFTERAKLNVIGSKDNRLF